MAWEFVRTGAILEDEESVYEDSYDTMVNEDFEEPFGYAAVATVQFGYHACHLGGDIRIKGTDVGVEFLLRVCCKVCPGEDIPMPAHCFGLQMKEIVSPLCGHEVAYVV